MGNAAREPNLAAWQWTLYPEGHTKRANLILHILTVPVFLSGTVTLLTSPFTRWLNAPVGLAMMLVAFAIQGAGHKRETTTPVPFDGPGDVLGRIFIEQWFNFPRYLLTGGWWRAWKAQGTAAHSDGA